MLFRYVQTEEKGKWQPIQVDKEYDKRVKEMGVVRASILAVSQILEDGQDNEEIEYKGPLYFDIDCGNLNLAISSTVDLVHKLKELDVPDEGIQVYCSGSKGFHVIVPETLFMTSARPMRSLPYVYMEMARDLYVTGLDFQVYSGGKGRMFRPENGKRPDQLYRVRITLEELHTMTPERYRELVQQPRDIKIKGPNGHKSALMQALFDRARKRALSKATLRGTALPLEQLQPYAEEPPACVDKLVKYEVLRNSNFNQAAMQFAAFVARAGTPDYKLNSLVDLMAEAGESTSYNTPHLRKVHLQGLVSYARAKPSLQFKCGAMRAVVGGKPCDGCPLDNKDLTETTEVDPDGAVLGVLAQPEGYFLKRETGDVRISTFTLHPLEIFVEEAQSGNTGRRVSTRMEVLSKGEKLGALDFDESGWRSKSEFIKQLEGLNVTFLGGDNDVQRLKYAVYRHTEEDEVDEVVNVHSAGIHVSNLGKKRVFTYVEPGLSVNTFGVQGTHRLQSRITAPPMLRMIPKPTSGDPALREALSSLMRVNAAFVVAQVMGWHCASHLRAHIHTVFKQFPVLSIWGEAGSGKTFTAELFAFLNGVDYRNNGSSIQLSTATLWPVIDVCSSTTTIPRLLDEFNLSKMSGRKGMYALIVEILKATWDGKAIPRGTLSRSKVDGVGRTGARVEEIYMTAPVSVCSEQAPQVPALQQRSIQVHLTRQAREGCTPAFNKALAMHTQLMQFARAATFMALRTTDEWIQEAYQKNDLLLPDGLYDRNRFSYATLLVGLDFFQGVSASLNLNLETEAEWLKSVLVDSIGVVAKEILQVKGWSEVDIFLAAIGEMAQLALQGNGVSQMIPGRNFAALPSRDELILDLGVIFPLYRHYVHRSDSSQVFTSLSQVAPLLKSEVYYKTNERVLMEMAGSRKLWVLSLSKMQEKGHDVTMFMNDRGD